MSKLTITKSGFMIEGYYHVELDTIDIWDKQTREWEDFKKEVDAQLEQLRKTKEAKGA